MSEKSIKLTRQQYRKLMDLEATQNVDAPKNDLETAPAVVSKSLTISKASVQSTANALAIALMVYRESEAILRRADRVPLADDLATEQTRIRAVSALLITDAYDPIQTETKKRFSK